MFGTTTLAQLTLFFTALVSFVLVHVEAAPIPGMIAIDAFASHVNQILNSDSGPSSSSQSDPANMHSKPEANNATATSGCFPAVGFKTPETLPSSTDNWWCAAETEYAYLGFSYEVTKCQSKDQLLREFKDIRERFNGRFVRMYGYCDKEGFYDDVIDAAYSSSLGLHALIWFGWTDPNAWKARRDSVLHTLTTNPHAPFVVRALQFGSEPLFDSALAPSMLAKEVGKAKEALKETGIQVTVSDMAFGYQKCGEGEAKEVLDAVDVLDIHTLPFFSAKASTASKAWPLVESDIDWFTKQVDGKKKIYLSQNGWPSMSYEGVKANSAAAVANVKNEADYYEMLDSHCDYFKSAPGGGVGWFAHLYSDAQEPGYGILGGDGKPKFDFKPLATC